MFVLTTTYVGKQKSRYNRCRRHWGRYVYRLATRRLWLSRGGGEQPPFGSGKRGGSSGNSEGDDNNNNNEDDQYQNSGQSGDADDAFNWSFLQRRVHELRASAFREARSSEENWKAGKCEQLALLVFEDDNVAGFKYVNSEVLVGSQSGRVRWVDLEDRRLLRSLEAPCSRLDPACVAATSALDFDGTVAVIGYNDGSLQYWFLHQETVVNFLAWPSAFAAPVVGVALLPGSRFAAASLDGRLRVYPAQAPRPDELTVPVPPLVDIDIQVPALSMEATPQHCLVGCLDGTVRIFSLSTGQCILCLNTYADDENDQTAGISAIFYEPDTEILWVGDELGLVRGLDLHQGGQVQRFRAHRGAVRSISADATKLVTAGRTTMPGVQEIQSAENVIKLAEPTRKETIPIPDAAQVLDESEEPYPHIESTILGLSGGSVRVWSRSYRRPLFELVGHSESLSTVQFDQNKMVSDGLGSVLLINRFGSGL
ncbi:hypothetical protein F1559_002466 [Cyanidiococcus yangmingshanensis]|uniref:Uncharacterized protein n=1 Tax=Cyanidiococcus yangmingshanensis TaxID=2690220 RepID=A0A7J7ID31_9RHOD|nr:hypothetical protein F1559_002466 [Cyanidiococcus yangmingshanensis]